jgi:hypothetical protein
MFDISGCMPLNYWCVAGMCPQQVRFSGHYGTPLTRFALTPVADSTMTSTQVLTSHDLKHGRAKSGTRWTSGLLAWYIHLHGSWTWPTHFSYVSPRGLLLVSFCFPCKTLGHSASQISSLILTTLGCLLLKGKFLRDLNVCVGILGEGGLSWPAFWVPQGPS